jgi:myo-inositol 2-dehydrogenase/D-chiro-inositol 1-dehydrogenase
MAQNSPVQVVEMQSPRTVAVGVIGVGGMGLRHVENLANRVVGARVAAVYDLDAARAAQVAQGVGARAMNAPHALVYSPAVDAVIIASPDSTHAELARACVAAGKPLLCEKPLGASQPQAQAVVDAEIASGRRLISLGFMRRFDPAHLAVKRAVESGAIGQPLLFKGASRAQAMAPDRPLDNIMSNTAIHDLDSARWFLCDEENEVRQVMVHALRSHDGLAVGTADLFLITLLVGERRLASIEVAMAVRYGYDIEATVVGTEGVAETQQPDVALVRRESRCGFVYPQEWLERFQSAYLAEVQEWVDSLRGLRPFGGATAWDGLIASRLADACTGSTLMGEPVAMHVPPKPALYR